MKSDPQPKKYGTWVGKRVGPGLHLPDGSLVSFRFERLMFEGWLLAQIELGTIDCARASLYRLVTGEYLVREERSNRSSGVSQATVHRLSLDELLSRFPILADKADLLEPVRLTPLAPEGVPSRPDTRDEHLRVAEAFEKSRLTQVAFSAQSNGILGYCVSESKLRRALKTKRALSGQEA